ncbi:hypothetical protein JCM33374_g6028 [Metschnikowia sp. JCM 33374]|nr:hypothetical protein JCM33374_g6028 [Metschnikowia sp. JCM 33374]
MDHDRNTGIGGKRRNPSSGFGFGLGASAASARPLKKPHLGPDLSALPTHLPCASTPFAPMGSSNFAPFTNMSSGVCGEESNKLPEVQPEVQPHVQPHAHASSQTEGVERQPNVDTRNGPLSIGPDQHAKPSRNPNTPKQESVSEDPQKGNHLSAPKPEKEPVFIEGTNITLQTEEDIAKWIAERRKKWPTRKNVEAKMQQQKEHIPEQEKNPTKQNICKFFSKNKRCKFGSKCRNVHETTTEEGQRKGPGKGPGNGNGHGNGPNPNGAGTSATRKMINGVLVNIPQRYKKEVNGAGSLFTKLVQRDLYEHENNIIVDFIQFLESKGMINQDATSS